MACECGGRGLFPDPVKSYLDWSGDLTRFGFKLERTIAMMWEAMMEPLPDELPDLPDELLEASSADEVLLPDELPSAVLVLFLH